MAEIRKTICPRTYSSQVRALESHINYEEIPNWQIPKTEVQEEFGIPKKQKRLVTRESVFEHCLFKEFYDEYVRSNNLGDMDDLGPRESEYYEHFVKNVILKKDEMIDGLIDKYPIYKSDAISVWSTKNRPRNTFKQRHSFSKPNSEQYDTQFG